MYPTLFSLGGIPFHSYGAMAALGFLAGILTTLYFAKQTGISAENILDLAVYVILAALLGARFFYVLGQWPVYQANPAEIFMLQNGGMVFLGGLFLSLIAVVWFARRKKLSLLKLLDTITPGTMLGYAIGRVGCFLNGCCFGMPAPFPWGVHFPHGSLADNYLPGTAVYPTQLYSAALMLAGFVLLLFLYKKKKFDGYIFYWGLILYSIYRFLIEFLRFSPLHWFYLTPAQWMVMGLGGFAVGQMVYHMHENR